MHAAMIPSTVILWSLWCNAIIGAASGITYSHSTSESDVCMGVHQTVVQGITPVTVSNEVSWSVYTSYTQVSACTQLIKFVFYS